MYRVGGSRETNTTFLNCKYLYFNENKTDIHSNATYIYVQPSTTLLTQKNKRNFSTIASRVTEKTSLPLSYSWPARKESPSTNTKFQWRPPPDSCCRHNSHADITDETITTQLVDQQLKESLYAVSRATERLSHEIRRGTNRQHHSYTNECLCDLHTSFTWEEDVCSYSQLQLDWLARQRAVRSGSKG